MKPKSHKPEPALPALFEEEPSRIESASPQNVRKLGFKQILVPIDFSDCSATALNYGLTIADRFGAKVTLLHVVEPAVYPENYMVPPSSMEEANQDLISSGRERLAKMVGRIPLQGTSIETLVRMGRAQSEITDTARATGCDLIIMGGHGSGGPKRAILGGTAERVLRQAPCPVLMVH